MWNCTKTTFCQQHICAEGKMTEFLAEDNVCGQNLLQIVAVGNAIIAEILRVKDYIPELYRLEKKLDQVKYAEIILDFSYFKISQAQEKKIEESSVSATNAINYILKLPIHKIRNGRLWFSFSQKFTS